LQIDLFGVPALITNSGVNGQPHPSRKLPAPMALGRPSPAFTRRGVIRQGVEAAGRGDGRRAM